MCTATGGFLQLSALCFWIIAIANSQGKIVHFYTGFFGFRLNIFIGFSEIYFSFYFQKFILNKYEIF